MHNTWCVLSLPTLLSDAQHPANITQCWVTVGPPSTTMAQQYPNIGSTSPRCATVSDSFIPLLWLSQKTRDFEPMLGWCWPIVYQQCLTFSGMRLSNRGEGGGESRILGIHNSADVSRTDRGGGGGSVHCYHFVRHCHDAWCDTRRTTKADIIRQMLTQCWAGISHNDPTLGQLSHIITPTKRICCV